ncbi:Dihydroorotate dehydrogenase, electron transfer subunit, iron-sulfur cluster binding domain protein [Thermovibrio ammonificans HB-1]|uniref:Dihydroorotate dehydrogenase, electron transfer subunit, iron-sulfur cluster binding domain protein n=1 Tax=Thermovibrio ammonificans (strain DSM 15698 / JCM 12110 / HB-1) TaxID=648996 RepID=E8T5C0_THEA1|nr:FAD/NAD(P)-binding protein [Thermovibrio ammonificans]ADU96458.1 Dihydroorotate dehydrogenase, electron transfer subunit, iron-sulfur cluster binding domain protein [Thermovibrio ammonificans HB-1]
MKKSLEKLLNKPLPVDPYLPHKVVITDVEELAPDHKKFSFTFLNEELNAKWHHLPGQFVMLTVPKAGEIPISICSSPTRRGTVELTVRKVGRKTEVLHRMKPGDLAAIRGPYGNGFPVEIMEGHNLLIIAGGLGIAPLRSLIWFALDRRHRFKEIYILYGTRNYQMVLYKEELKRLRERSDVKCLFVLDRCETAEDREWADVEGVLTALIPQVELDPADTYVAVCGPPVAYRFIGKELLKNGYPESQIFVSLERKMECGIGKCGHCQIGYKFACVDGPIFPLWDTKNLPEMI